MEFFDQLIEFAGNHLILVSAFAVLLVALIVTENRRGGQSVSVQEATRLINREQAVVVDLRSEAEYKAGHIINAVNMPYTSLASRVKEIEKHKDKTVILVCKMGQHSRAAGKVLLQSGFDNVTRMTGGMTEWSGSSLPLVKS